MPHRIPFLQYGKQGCMLASGSPFVLRGVGLAVNLRFGAVGVPAGVRQPFLCFASLLCEPAVCELRLGALLVQEAELLRFVGKLVAEIGMRDANKALRAGGNVGPAQSGSTPYSVATKCTSLRRLVMALPG